MTISLIIIGALLVAAVGGGLVVWASYGGDISDYLGWSETDYEGSGSGEVVVAIAAGDDGYAIADTLEASGVVLTAGAFVSHVLAQDPVPVFQPGAYTLAKKMSSAAALDALLNPDNRVEMTAVIPEGTRASRIYEIISGVTGIPVADFETAAQDPTALGIPATAPNVEGWLFPATYEFAMDDTAQSILQKLVTRMVQALDEAGVPVDDRERVLTIASIVQREARATDAFYKVSRVIQNRLDQGMKLQMDSTSKYGMPNGSADVWTTTEQRDSDNGWNTYYHTGLPIGPISNPGDVAIDAALHPAEGTWLYFVTVNQDTGETLFSSTLPEHEQLVEQARQWCVANPENAAC
ncbi:endolytic transglycosylase MltG [Klugiella xanthotipulae]|nr:endolytic transglycosylase MltG [Klugiella xanthotipulae]